MSAPLLFAMMHALEAASPNALPPMHRLVMLVLADYADEAGWAWPSAETIARRTGQAPRTVETCLAELRASGWLEAEPRSVGGRRLSNRYRVKIDGRGVCRARLGRHTAPRAESAPDAVSDTAPPAVPQVDRYRAPCGSLRAPCGVDTAPRSADTAPPAEDPIRDPISEPTKENLSGGSAGFALEPPAPKPAKGEGSRKSAGERRKPAHAMPEGWAPDESVYRTGAELGFDRPLVDREMAKFRDRNLGEVQRDWQGTARNWLRKAREFADERKARAPVVGLQPPAKPGQWSWMDEGYKEFKA